MPSNPSKNNSQQSTLLEEISPDEIEEAYEKLSKINFTPLLATIHQYLKESLYDWNNDNNKDKWSTVTQINTFLTNLQEKLLQIERAPKDSKDSLNIIYQKNTILEELREFQKSIPEFQKTLGNEDNKFSLQLEKALNNFLKFINKILKKSKTEESSPLLDRLNATENKIKKAQIGQSLGIFAHQEKNIDKNDKNAIIETKRESKKPK